MNLVQSLRPYAEELHKFEQSGRIKTESLIALKEIYEEYWKDHNYIGPATIKLSCGGCVFDMCRALWNNYKRQANAHTVNFKGVPDKKMREPLKPLVEPAKDETISINPAPPKVDWDSKTWNEIKDKAKSLEISLKAKNKKQIISEINSKSV